MPARRSRMRASRKARRRPETSTVRVKRVQHQGRPTHRSSKPGKEGSPDAAGSLVALNHPAKQTRSRARAAGTPRDRRPPAAALSFGTGQSRKRGQSAMSVDVFFRPQACRPASSLDPARAAVIVVDMVNDFCKPGGKMVLPGVRDAGAAAARGDPRRAQRRCSGVYGCMTATARACVDSDASS